MQRIIFALIVLALSGCTAYDAFLMGKFDNAEYRMITEIRTDSARYATQCNDSSISKTNATFIANKITLFMNYSEKLSHNEDTYNAAKSLNDIGQGLQLRYASAVPVTPLYCKLKFQIIEHSADTIQHVLGNRPR